MAVAQSEFFPGQTEAPDVADQFFEFPLVTIGVRGSFGQGELFEQFRRCLFYGNR